MAVIRANGVAGKLSADLTSGGTTMNSAGLADLPAVASPDIAKITLFQTDTNGRVTTQEIVYVTAHTASATSATITRGQEGTSGHAWSGTSSPDSWVHAPTAADIAGVDVQTFTASGTWTKPANVSFVDVICIGGGSGGGSGRRGAAGVARGGGGGGASANYSAMRYRASDLPSTVTVTVGAAGTGGAARTTDNSDGLQGNAGGTTTFGAFLKAGAGQGGTGGTQSAAAAGGSGATATAGLYAGVFGGDGGNNGGTGSNGASGPALSPSSGAGGGGVTAGDIVANGGQGSGQNVLGGPAAATNGSPGGNGGSAGYVGLGGGGGDGSKTVAAGAGGNGGNFGAGGGGGGGSLNGFNSGKGGDGAGGVCIVTSW